jgi:CDP-paratose 2-epimerase
MKRALVTGSSGLIGSECVAFLDARGWEVHGVDNNMRREFFGPDGDTSWNLTRLRGITKHFVHHARDIRDREGILDLVKTVRPAFIIHCAAQPSHDLAQARPFDDFDTNAGGTLNLLEAVRRVCPESPFVFLSTNKVYGDAPNRVPLVELDTRYEYARPEDHAGISETCSIDQCLHSLFGASKTAADVMVQEYGRYFGLRTAVFRGGTLTGPAHAAAELHGFLAYLMRTVMEGRTYRLNGFKGKMVRDAIHSHDVLTAFELFFRAPRFGEVYNIGGGRHSNTSHIEAFALAEQICGRPARVDYHEQTRVGDHQWYVSSTAHFQSHYPQWTVTYDVPAILREIYAANVDRWRPAT